MENVELGKRRKLNMTIPDGCNYDDFVIVETDFMVTPLPRPIHVSVDNRMHQAVLHGMFREKVVEYRKVEPHETGHRIEHSDQPTELIDIDLNYFFVPALKKWVVDDECEFFPDNWHEDYNQLIDDLRVASADERNIIKDKLSKYPK